VLAAVKQAKPANLERVELFDVFRGKNVPERQKSLAYAFTYRHAERTRHRRRGECAAREARRPLQAGIAGDGARQLNALLTSQVAQFGAFSLPRPEDDVILSTNSHARSLLLLSQFFIMVRLRIDTAQRGICVPGRK
jgi:Ferredoxin-fold anticodon binding domain